MISSITRFAAAAVVAGALATATPTFAGSVVFGGIAKGAEVTGHAVAAVGRDTGRLAARGAHTVARPFHGRRARTA
jgi:hypothetical protein